MRKVLRVVALVGLLGCLLTLELKSERGDTMPRGAPDYSNVRAYGPLKRLDDMAELAARLGSPVTHERSGRIVYFDSFEEGMASWQTAANGTGASVAVSAENKRHKAFSVKMVAGSDGGASVQMARAFPYPTLNKYGLEFSLMLEHTPLYLIWTLARRDGAEEHQFQCMYTPGDKEIVVTIPGGSSVAIKEDIELFVGSGLFHTFKLIVDFENNVYEALIINEERIELGEYEPYTFDYVSSPHTNVIITLYGNAGDNDTAYIDDVILTQAEE